MAKYNTKWNKILISISTHQNNNNYLKRGCS